MILKRNGREVDELNFVKSSDAMLRMQKIADKLINYTPEINKFLPSDSLLRTAKIQPLQPKVEAPPISQNSRALPKLTRDGGVNSTAAKTEQNSEEAKQRQQELEALVEQQKIQNERLKQEFEGRNERYAQRELEYRRIIEEIQSEIREKAAIQIGEAKKMEQATKNHQEVQEKIARLQVKTSHVLVDQEKTVIRFFNDKIAEIKKQFEEERIKKGKKDQDYIQREHQLVSELEWIENIAQKIDNENINLMKKFMDLQAQYQTQENDRDNLIKELLMKKKQNEILSSQIQNYEKMLEQVQIEEDNLEQIYEDEQIDQKDAFSESKQLSRIQESAPLIKPNQLQLPQIPSNSISKINNLKVSPLSQPFEDPNSSLIPKKKMTKTKSTNWVMKKYNKQANAVEESRNSFQDSNRFSKSALIGSQKEGNVDQLAERESRISEIQAVLKQVQKEVRELKQKYLQELFQKTEIQTIIRDCISDRTEEIIEAKRRRGTEDMIAKIIQNEKTLTLIYDKAFFVSQKQIDVVLTEKQRQKEKIIRQKLKNQLEIEEKQGQDQEEAAEGQEVGSILKKQQSNKDEQE